MFNCHNLHESTCMNVVITGASKGIGKAVAEKFASHGHNVYLSARGEEQLRITATDIARRHPDITVRHFIADSADKRQVIELASVLKDLNIDIDVLVNNAGSFLPGNVSTEPDGMLEQMLAVNLMSAYHLTRALLPLMIPKQRGHIFNMCSIASLQAYRNGGSYSISKFALSGFSKNLREELKPHKIKVTGIYPGAAYTDSWAGSGVDPDRIMKAEDISDIIYSASQLSFQACVEEIILRPLAGDL
jgi:short-subunit dehydrogenase